MPRWPGWRRSARRARPQRLEAEAAEHRAAVEATQRDYESTMRRADDIDPDVKESSFAPVERGGSDEEPAPAGSTTRPVPGPRPPWTTSP